MLYLHCIVWFNVTQKAHWLLQAYVSMVQSRLGVILLLKVHTLRQLLFIVPQVMCWKRKTLKRASASHQSTVFIAQSPASWKCCVSVSSGRIRQAHYFGLFDRGCWISDRFLLNGLKHPLGMCIRKLMPAVSLPHLLTRYWPYISVFAKVASDN